MMIMSIADVGMNEHVLGASSKSVVSIDACEHHMLCILSVWQICEESLFNLFNFSLIVVNGAIRLDRPTECVICEFS